jgi:hypothetical protein
LPLLFAILYERRAPAIKSTATKTTLYADYAVIHPSSKSPALPRKHLQRYLNALADWGGKLESFYKCDEEHSSFNYYKMRPVLAPLTFIGAKVP